MKDWKDIDGMEGRYPMSGEGSMRVLPHFVRGRKAPMKILDLKYQEVVAIKKRLAQGEHPYCIAEDMGVSRNVISRINSGRSFGGINSYRLLL